MITFNVDERENFSLLSFELADGVIDANQLGEAVALAPKGNGQKGLIVSGRGPVWLLAALTHEVGHCCRWAATFDPRVGGGVVVSRHHETAPQIGEVVPV